MIRNTGIPSAVWKVRTQVGFEQYGPFATMRIMAAHSACRRHRIHLVNLHHVPWDMTDIVRLTMCPDHHGRGVVKYILLSGTAHSTVLYQLMLDSARPLVASNHA